MSLPGIAEGFTDQGSLTPDNFIAGEFPRISRLVIVTGGVVLPQGAVLGRITADGRYQLSDASASDGSEAPEVILAEPVDATITDVQAHVYFTGEFNAALLTLGAGHTLESVTNAFRQRSLFLRNNQA
jgi:Bacteriophage lambda head decoration protein D